MNSGREISTHLLSSPMSREASVALHHHLVPLINIIPRRLLKHLFGSVMFMRHEQPGEDFHPLIEMTVVETHLA